MYGNDEEVYGEEMDGDEDRNDGLNALVIIIIFNIIEFATCHGFQQGH